MGSRVREVIKQCISRQEKDETELNSFEFLDLLTKLEDAFSITFEAEEIQKIAESPNSEIIGSIIFEKIGEEQ